MDAEFGDLLSCFGELDDYFSIADSESLDSLWGASTATIGNGAAARTNSPQFQASNGAIAAHSYLADLLSDRQDSLPTLLDDDSSNQGAGPVSTSGPGMFPGLPTFPLSEVPHRLSSDTTGSHNSTSNSGHNNFITTAPTTSLPLPLPPAHNYLAPSSGALYASSTPLLHPTSSNPWQQQQQQQQHQHAPTFRVGDVKPLLKVEDPAQARQLAASGSPAWTPMHTSQAAVDIHHHSLPNSPGSAPRAQPDTFSAQALSRNPSSNGRGSHGSGGSGSGGAAATTVKRVRGASKCSNAGGTTGTGPKAQLEQLQAVVKEKHALIEKLQREKQALLNTTSVLELIIQCRNQQVIRLQSGDPLQAPPGCPPGPIPCDPASMKSYAQMNAQQLMATFKPILSEMSTALLNAENSTDPAAGVKLQGVMSNFLFVVQHISLYNPEILKTVSLTLNGEQLQASEAHWAGVALSLNLSPKQLEDAQVLFNLYSRWLDRIHRERLELSAQLAKAMQMPRYGVVYKERQVGGQEMDHLDDVALLGALQKSVTRERCVVLLAAEVFNTRLLSYSQWARAVVSSYPWILDSPAIMEAAAKVAAGGKTLGMPL